jgi:drug/metabolite transporter (DMT)-like permease
MNESPAPILHKKTGFYPIVLLLGCICTASVPLWFRFSHVGEATAGIWRMMFALPFIFLWMYFEPKKNAQQGETSVMTGQAYGLLAFAGFIFAFDILLFNSALSYASVTNVAILAGLSPFVMIFKAVVFERLRLTSWMVLALGIAFFGVVLLVLGAGAPKASNVAILEETNVFKEFFGSVLALGSSISFGLYLLCLRQVRRYHVPAARVVGVSVIFAALGSFFLALILGETLLPQSTQSWLSLIGLGVIGHFFGHGLMTLSFRHVSAVLASASVFLLPGFSALLAWIFLKENVTWIQLLGAAMVLSSLMYLSPQTEATDEKEISPVDPQILEPELSVAKR